MNPFHEHCSSQNFSKKKLIIKLIKNKQKNQIKLAKIFEKINFCDQNDLICG